MQHSDERRHTVNGTLVYLYFCAQKKNCVGASTKECVRRPKKKSRHDAKISRVKEVY